MVQRLPQFQFDALRGNGSDLWKTKVEMCGKPFIFELKSGSPHLGKHMEKVALQQKSASMKRSCSAVPQRNRPPSNGAFQNIATSARTSSICRRFMRTCGGISKRS